MQTILTTEELAEFTPLNAAAFDLIRTRAQEKNIVPPCWLCMSDEAKDQARQDLVDYFNTNGHSCTLGNLTQTINHTANSVSPMIESWKQAELSYKAHRESGNPQAYFAQ